MNRNKRIVIGIGVAAIVVVSAVGYVRWWERHTNTPPDFAHVDHTDEAAFPILDLYSNELGTTTSDLEFALNTARYGTAVRCLRESGYDVNRGQLARQIESPLAELHLQRQGNDLVVPQPPTRPAIEAMRPCLTKAVDQFPDPTLAFAEFLRNSLPIPKNEVKAFTKKHEAEIVELATAAKPQLEPLRPWLPED
jgi:hypothetical protein